MRRTSWGLLATLLTASNALGSDQELLNILLENGAIQQAQYEALMGSQGAPGNFWVNENGLTVDSPDGEFQFVVGGRLHMQASFHDEHLPSASEPSDGSELRRARFHIRARVYEEWELESDIDFADNEPFVKDFFVAYTGMERAKLSAGLQKQPFSLDIEMSTNDLPFIERSVDHFLIVPFVDRAMGVRSELHGDHVFFAGGIYGESVEAERDGDDGFGTAARLIFLPVLERDRVVHLGIRGALRWLSSADDPLVLQDQTTNFSDLSVVRTMDIPDVDRVDLYGPEAALVWGPVSVYGEYHWAVMKRNPGSDLKFNGGYVAATYALTGESRATAYRIAEGEFKRITPERNFTANGGGCGAWELATRLARLDLNNRDIRGGREIVLTNALNWSINPVVRVMFEWTRILEADSNSIAGGDARGTDIFQTRIGFRF